jgi:quinolinate synthase
MKYNECAAMKRITLENTYQALKDEKPVIDVPVEIAERALIPIKRMIEMTR